MADEDQPKKKTIENSVPPPPPPPPMFSLTRVKEADASQAELGESRDYNQSSDKTDQSD